jgi:hypothetical protein
MYDIDLNHWVRLQILIELADFNIDAKLFPIFLFLSNAFFFIIFFMLIDDPSLLVFQISFCHLL